MVGLAGLVLRQRGATGRSPQSSGEDVDDRLFPDQPMYVGPQPKFEGMSPPSTFHVERDALVPRRRRPRHRGAPPRTYDTSPSRPRPRGGVRAADWPNPALGSVTRGEDREDSDIDLLVVAPERLGLFGKPLSLS